MRITTLETDNWLPYRGAQRLGLDATAYGVTAQKVRETSRSNWLGKTSLLGAVRFALFGDHPASTEDEWITRGESEGSVVLTLSDGFSMARSRRKGAATRIEARPPGAPPCVGDEAQLLIERWIGLSKRDFLATSFFEQKRMHRFVAARPAERFADVAAWVRLGPLRKAEEETRKKLGSLVDREARLAERARLLRERLGDDQPATLARLEEANRRAAAEATRAAARADEADGAAAEDAERRALEGRAREHEAAKKELAAIPAAPARPAAPGLRVRAEEAAGVLREARATVARRRVLARGEFDGACPVAPIECPAKAEINRKKDEGRKLLAKAEAWETAVATELAKSRAAAEKAEHEAREEEQARAREGWLRKRVAETAADAERAKDLGPARPGDLSRREGDAARLDATRAAGRAAACEAELRAARRDEADLAKADQELSAVRREAQTLREAAAILGRAGAQRRIAEEAVREIERGANERLASAGVELSVRLSWGRETGDLAPACDACGAPFSPGRSAKACRCGAERGPKVIDELGCELSSVSGAAEDLAGVALSLSAASWIRADRTAGWGVALVDEPFGSLDETNRRAMARMLAGMLGPAGGFEQALVVAHHEGAMEALPGRIRIVGGPHGSWARVA